MLKKLSVSLFSMALMIGFSASAQAQHHNKRMVLLGERHLDDRMDSAKIDISRDNGSFRAIQFRVRVYGVR
ncbi:MAG: hypothetical protein ABIQ10_05925 [Gemmatimonadaceae bacterium]